MNLLLVEDEASLSNFIKKGFESEGINVEVAYDGTIARSKFNANRYDLAILDINLPGINGFELCKQFKKAHPYSPVIFLTALDGIDDKVAGFEAGAEDYLVKPFEFKELLLRIKALIKRANSAVALQRKLTAADLEMDADAKIVTRAGKRIDLTAREFGLLEYLLINKGRTVSRIDIAEKVWDLNFDTSTNVIDVYINYLRKKIEKGFDKKILHTVVGMGYVIRED
ncbi:MAG: response regulator transcription factor [Bacteroidetes bacterium]|jgi:two-component system copper resistance phosphate regulon response regulator CusR|nr:response regulator transcription factor [Bacteroidota bacterium]MBS1980802.1 response regulator transcription factor [Bacteroidota bacterium]